MRAKPFPQNTYGCGIKSTAKICSCIEFNLILIRESF